MRSVLTIFILGMLLTGTGCNLVNPKENIPTYVRIDSFSFATKDYMKEGTRSQKITSAWVYFNNKALGTYTLPANVPIITDGPGELQVIPGISYNGLSNAVQFPFFTSYTTPVPFTPGKATAVVPQVSYLNDTKFQWKEDFELGNSFMETNSLKAEDTSIVRVTDSKVYEGGGAGYIYLDATHPSSESISNVSFPITQGESFLELNYKSTTSFVVGVQTVVSGAVVYEYIGGVNPKDEWNKIYFNLSTFTNQYQASQYRIMIKATLNSGLSNGYVLLDNIKVISF